MKQVFLSAFILLLFNTVIHRNSLKHSMDISFSWCHFILCIHHIFCYQCCYINEIMFYTWRVFPLDHHFNGYLLWQLFQWNYFLRLSVISTQPRLHWLFVMPIMSIKSFSAPGEYFNWVTIAIAYRLLRSTPSHYLDQFWFNANWALGNIFHWNLNKNTTVFIHPNNQHVVCGMAVILPRPQCVNKKMTHMPFIKPEMNYKERSQRFRIYRQISYISGPLWDNKIVDHSDVVGASPVDAAPTTSSLST